MLLEILSYFCILFTLTILIYWPFINHFKQGPFVQRTKPYVTGLKFGVSGLILTSSAIHLTYGFMVNTRIISLLFSGLLGGPIAILISGLIMGIGRLFLPDLTTVTFFINLNFIVVVIILFFVSRKYELNKQTIFTYFWICFLEIMVVLFTGLCFNGKGFFYVMLFTLFTIFSFYFIYLVIYQVKSSSDTVQETTYLERIDYLTQLPNNVAIEKHFQVLLKKKANFNLLLVDINDFKIINSLYGYTVGDSVIKQLAQLLQEYAQKNGAFVGRLSGEEFLIMIKDVPPAMAIVEANNVIKYIAKHSFEGPESIEIHISISIGLSSYPDNGTDVQSLMKSSNVAHQHAKTSTTASYFHANNL